MKIRNFPFYAVALFMAILVIVPAGAFAGDADTLTKRVMSGGNPDRASGASREEVRVTNNEKKKNEVQINLGDQLRAYISGGESPYGRDLAGKPLRGNYRTTFGFHIPL